MIEFTCRECSNVHEVGSTVIRIIGGEVRKEGDTCPKCGGRCDHSNPKEGMPAMQFTDSGTGKRKVL